MNSSARYAAYAELMARRAEEALSEAERAGFLELARGYSQLARDAAVFEADWAGLAAAEHGDPAAQG